MESESCSLFFGVFCITHTIKTHGRERRLPLETGNREKKTSRRDQRPRREKWEEKEAANGGNKQGQKEDAAAVQGDRKKTLE